MSKVIFDKVPNQYNSILIIQHFEGQVVYVKNKKRKWELTGGKKEEGESINETIVRESKEESGAIINEKSIKIIGYYELDDGHTTLISEVEVIRFNKIPSSSEIIERKLMHSPMVKEKLSFQDTIYDQIFRKIGWKNGQ